MPKDYLKLQPGARCPALLGADAGRPNLIILNDDQGCQDLAVRGGDWQYLSEDLYKATTRKPNGPTLSSLKDDIGESGNGIAQYPEVANRLKTALDQHQTTRNLVMKADPLKRTAKKPFPMKLFSPGIYLFCLLAAMSGKAQSIPYTCGRIAVSCDGNMHDPDDKAATPATLAILASQGLQDKLVVYIFNDHVWGSSATGARHMKDAVNGCKDKFGFNRTIFISAVDDPSVAYHAMRDAILASSRADPLTIICEGPMQVVGEGLRLAKAENEAPLRWVRLMTHSKSNNQHADLPRKTEVQHSGWTWDEMVAEFSGSGVAFTWIADQNSKTSGSVGFCSAEAGPGGEKRWDVWHFLRDYDRHSPEINAGIQFIYSQMEFIKRPDFSDAGIAYDLITGDEQGGPAGLKKMLDDGFVKKKVGVPVVMPAVRTMKVRGTSPNIVYILADDLGSGDVQCYNADGKIPTPNIDSLARDGMKFTDAHTCSSICTPSRYGILTGRYAWRTSLKHSVIKGMAKPLIESERETVASFLKKQGYQTACIGKWHLGLGWSYKDKTLKEGSASEIFKPFTDGPLDHGFDYFFGMSASFNLAPHLFIENRMVSGDVEKVVKKEELRARNINGSGGWVAKGFQQDQVLSTLTRKTCEWIEQHADRPFFAYMPLNAPHYPVIPREEFRGKSGLSLYGDFVMETDWAVGKVLQTLDRLKLSDNTIVIVTSDNGVSEMVHVDEMEKNGHYSSGIYRGLKGNIWEGGHRMPFLVRWPGIVNPESVCDQPISTTDLLATVADLLNKPLAENAGEDSVSFLPALSGKPIPGNDTRLMVHNSGTGLFGGRQGKWKLVLDETGACGKRFDPKDQPVINQDPKQMLFDMDNDPVESTNIAAQHPETVDVMKKELAAIIKNGRSTPGPNQPTDVDQAIWPQIDSLRSYMK